MALQTIRRMFNRALSDSLLKLFWVIPAEFFTAKDRARSFLI